jgi:hypothetical protein
MTQLSIETEDRTAQPPVLEDKPRPRSRRLFGNSNFHAAEADSAPEPQVAPRDADLWDEGRVAARAGNHEKAIACFVEEADLRTMQGSHGRAAIAFRAAAEEARLQGMALRCDQLLEQAAASYTNAAQSSGLAQDATQQAWVLAAKCFLQLQQLDRAAWCIEQARTADPSRVIDESAKTPS